MFQAVLKDNIDENNFEIPIDDSIIDDKSVTGGKRERKRNDDMKITRLFEL